MGNEPVPGAWGCDTGCFSTKGADGFRMDPYLRWLQRRELSTNLFATAPDVLGDPEATLRLSLPELPKLRALGVRAALVAQDGLEDLTVPWDAFDCLFVGGRPPAVKGQPEWKDSPGAARLILEALARGKFVHAGRVNSQLRYDRMASLGVHSCDGTFLAYGPTVNLPRLCAWIDAPVPAIAA
jgi:hypothetical protein